MKVLLKQRNGFSERKDMIVNSKVKNSRPLKGGAYIRRRRELRSGERVTTLEIEEKHLKAVIGLLDIVQELKQSTPDDIQKSRQVLKELGYLI